MRLHPTAFARSESCHNVAPHIPCSSQEFGGKKLEADACACAHTQQPLHAQTVITMLLHIFLAAHKKLDARSWMLTLALALSLNSLCTLRQLSQCCSSYSLQLTRRWSSMLMLTPSSTHARIKNNCVACHACDAAHIVMNILVVVLSPILCSDGGLI